MCLRTYLKDLELFVYGSQLTGVQFGFMQPHILARRHPVLHSVLHASEACQSTEYGTLAPEAPTEATIGHITTHTGLAARRGYSVHLAPCLHCTARPASPYLPQCSAPSGSDCARPQMGCSTTAICVVLLLPACK